MTAAVLAPVLFLILAAAVLRYYSLSVQRTVEAFDGESQQERGMAQVVPPAQSPLQVVDGDSVCAVHVNESDERQSGSLRRTLANGGQTR